MDCVLKSLKAYRTIGRWAFFLLWSASLNSSAMLKSDKHMKGKYASVLYVTKQKRKTKACRDES